MIDKTNINTVFVQVINFPSRKLILKRNVEETHHIELIVKNNCNVWTTLSNVREALYEPVEMWIPQNMIDFNTSGHALGVEVPVSYDGSLPVGFELLELQPCKMMVFQGQSYNNGMNMCETNDFHRLIDGYDPELYGFKWADEDAPRIRLVSMGYRGHIEVRPIRLL